VTRSPDQGALPPELAIVVDGPAVLGAARQLFPDAERCALTRDESRPRIPFQGPLFERLAKVPSGSCVALIVPMARRRSSGGAAVDAASLVPVADHVNLQLCGPLTGRWPAGVPRSFPPLAGIYQPALVRAHGGARVYSSGVIVAGVTDAARLTPFEAGAVAEAGLSVVSDSLVPPVIVAAYYGLTVAACGVVRTDDNNEE
jgi:hypothetical protein